MFSLSTNRQVIDDKTHKADSSSVEQAQELSLSDFKQVLTLNQAYRIPPTVARGIFANILASCSTPTMIREVLVGLKMQDFFGHQTDTTDSSASGFAAFDVQISQV